MPFQKGKSGNPKTMFKPGKSGNPNGKKPGLKSLSTLVQEVINDPDLLEKTIQVLPKKKQPTVLLETLEDKRLAYVGILVMALRWISGDVQAAHWIRKTGYGDKLDLTSDDRPIRALQVIDMSPPKPKRKATKKPTKPVKPNKGAKDAGTKGVKPKAKRSRGNGSKPKNTKA